jgi:drug/metabolite transporter (DMT)-like permease
MTFVIAYVHILIVYNRRRMNGSTTLTLETPARTASTWPAYAALGAGVVGITWGALFVRWAGIPGPASAFYRVLVAALILVPWRAAATSAPMPSRRAALIALASGVFFACDLALFNVAVLRTSATAASLLGNNSPIFVGLGAWLLFRERPRAAFWIGLGLALAGGAVIVSMDAGAGAAAAGSGASGGGAFGDVTGDLMAVAASAFFAAYLMMTARVRAQMDTLTFNTLAIVGSVVTLWVVCVALGVPLGGYSWQVWSLLVGLGLIAQLASYFAISYALGHLPAAQTSVGLLAQAPLTAVLAMPLLGESITAGQVIGSVLVLTGIYVVNRGDRA